MREQVQTELGRCGIGTAIHYPLPPYRQQAYRDLNLPPGSFPIADKLASEVLSLPMGPHVPGKEWLPALRQTFLQVLQAPPTSAAGSIH